MQLTAEYLVLALAVAIIALQANCNQRIRELQKNADQMSSWIRLLLSYQDRHRKEP